MKGKDIIRLLEQDGWFLKRPKGSCNIFKHPNKTGMAVVAPMAQWIFRKAPDLPGLDVAADTRDEAAWLIREGIAIYLEELRDDGLPLPVPANFAGRVAAAA